MEQRELINGFSDLKSLLMTKYNIEKAQVEVKLFFTEKNNELLMHDYSDHQKMIILCSDIKEQYLIKTLSPAAVKLVKESLNHFSPSNYLNEGFNLYGFFR